MRFMTLIAFAYIVNYAHAVDDVAILSAIGQVETGGDYFVVADKGRSLGAYSLTRNAWVDGCTQLMRERKNCFSFSQWRDPYIQDTVGLALIRCIRGRLAVRGITDPTPEQIALCWNMGYAAASHIGFDHTRAKSSYAERVGNLVRQ
jgi:hypothetical protein